MSPVGILEFLLLLSETTPFAWTTYSLPIFLALRHKSELVSILKTNCVIP